MKPLDDTARGAVASWVPSGYCAVIPLVPREDMILCPSLGSARGNKEGLWLGFLSDLIQSGIARLVDVVGNYGLAIIILTVLVRLLLLPFTLAQTRSTLKMQALNPEVQALQKKYKNNPERFNQEQMALWKKHGVNPLSSCLLLLIQFPFLIAFFQALEGFQPLQHARFLGIVLGQPERIVLPLLTAVTTFLSMKVSAPATSEKSQAIMQYMFPVMIWWMSMRFPAALSLYWLVSNILAVGERYLLPRSFAPAKEGARP
jgi:YidC/Oxa1 family membrane protein insertase